MIKSALEIAMEKTRDLKVDTKGLARTEARNEGKRIAGAFLNEPAEHDIAKELSSVAKEKREDARFGAFEVLSSRVQLPIMANPELDNELAALAAGFKALHTGLMGDKKIQAIFDELGAFLKQFLENAKALDENLRKQYAPRLKQKEQQLAMQMGRPVQLDPMQDPEFAAIYKQNAGQLKGQYQQALEGIKQELAGLCGIKPDAE
ncbi:MAG: hypothetical protein KKI09_16285 [Spirochaetes bacterium]|nr:hypothetical protein [Spirochaetota bacterium]MBU0956982.1 hypothetical protein [Spirochaetota bacterium]